MVRWSGRLMVEVGRCTVVAEGIEEKEKTREEGNC